jgi:multidrug efflux pump subunit AcrA (membrane-fusion protein)
LEDAPILVKAAVISRTQYALGLGAIGEAHAQIESEPSLRCGGRVVEWDAEVVNIINAKEFLRQLDPQERNTHLGVAEAGVQAAEAQLKQAQFTFDRQTTLQRRGFTTQREFDQAHQELRMAKQRPLLRMPGLAPHCPTQRCAPSPGRRDQPFILSAVATRADRRRHGSADHKRVLGLCRHALHFSPHR